MASSERTAGKWLAGSVGGFFTTVVMTVAITLLWPFGDRIEQIFAGGVFFFVFWSVLFYFAMLAASGLRAWGRIGSLFLLFAVIDVVALYVFR